MSTLTRTLAEHVVSTRFESWPDTAVDKIRIHIFDTLIAMYGGLHLPAGKRALKFCAARPAGPGERSHVVGTDLTLAPESAALVNGILAHADETDDTSEIGRLHPGASIVPAAFALGECLGRSGRDVLNAILTGYNIGIAFPQAVWADGAERMHSTRTTHNVGQIMGAVAAAGQLLRLDAQQMCYAFSYAAQQTSGLNSLYRDIHHIEKAYVFGGLPAEQGLRAAHLAKLGFTGVEDIFDASINFFESFDCRSEPERLLAALEDPQGGVFEADIKLYPVGLPIQAAAQAMDDILAKGQIDATQVQSIECRLPSQKAHVVDDRDMPQISLQYILATMIEDGGLTFANSHDQGRLDRERDAGLMTRVNLIHDKLLDPADDRGSRNRAHLRVILDDGTMRSANVDELNGTRFRPASWPEMLRKAEAVLPKDNPLGPQELVDLVKDLEETDFTEIGARLQRHTA